MSKNIFFNNDIFDKIEKYYCRKITNRGKAAPKLWTYNSNNYIQLTIAMNYATIKLCAVNKSDNEKYVSVFKKNSKIIDDKFYSIREDIVKEMGIYIEYEKKNDISFKIKLHTDVLNNLTDDKIEEVCMFWGYCGKEIEDKILRVFLAKCLDNA